MYVKKFEELSKSDIGIAGGKGANLGELTQAGIPVPPGFVVTAQAYKYFMDEAGINDQVMEILDAIDINDTKALQAAAEEIKTIIIESPVKMTPMWQSGHPQPLKICLKLHLQANKILSYMYPVMMK